MRDPYSATMGAGAGLGATGPLTGQAGVPYSGGLGVKPTQGGGFNWKDFGVGAGIGGLLPGLLGGLFGDSGPSPMSYLSQIGKQVSPYLQPYSTAGQSMLPGLEKQYSELAGSPGEMLNKIGGQFHQSPGFNFMMNQALQGAGHAAAAGGMAGSPEAQQQSQQLATNLANQDYYNWLNKAMGMYSQGLQGMQGLAGMGQQAGMGMSEAIAQALSAQAQAAQEQQAQQAQSEGGLIGGIGSIIGSLIP